jgi:1-acyl-sn-glycerol-3-phosphate acyltransferase
MSQPQIRTAAAQVPKMVQVFSKWLIKLLGWQIVGDFNGIDKCVIITQHTSNWDGILTIFAAFSLGIRPRWIGKHQLFRGVMGSMMRRAGGIEVSRSQSANVVDQVAARFAEEDHLWLFIAPEGTRHKVDYWKTGFYYIALKANVPIVHGYLDYAERKVGVGTRLQPSGDIHADMEIIQTWFTHTQPKFPENAAEIRLNPQEKN